MHICDERPTLSIFGGTRGKKILFRIGQSLIHLVQLQYILIFFGPIIQKISYLNEPLWNKANFTIYLFEI